MKTKLYDKYYKLGFDHFMFKKVMGLHKPDKSITIFYSGVIVLTIVFGMMLN